MKPWGTNAWKKASPYLAIKPQCCRKCQHKVSHLPCWNLSPRLTYLAEGHPWPWKIHCSDCLESWIWLRKTSQAKRCLFCGQEWKESAMKHGIQYAPIDWGNRSAPWAATMHAVHNCSVLAVYHHTTVSKTAWIIAICQSCPQQCLCGDVQLSLQAT